MKRKGGGGSENSLFSYGKIFVTSERGRKKTVEKITSINTYFDLVFTFVSDQI